MVRAMWYKITTIGKKTKRKDKLLKTKVLFSKDVIDESSFERHLGYYTTCIWN